VPEPCGDERVYICMSKYDNLRLSALVLALAAVLGAGCARPDIRSGMARLDGAYIPALSLTSEGDTARSKAALAVLSVEWHEFRRRHGRWAKADTEWQPDLSRAETMIQRAVLLADADSLARAHDELEPVRTVMMKLRRRNGIDYFLDYLTEFHPPMEALVSAGKSRLPESLNPGALDSLKTEYALAASAWNRVESAGLDRWRYELNQQQRAEAEAHIKAESEALGRLGDAFAARDRAAVLKAAATLKPEFAALYKMFGDYARLR